MGRMARRGSHRLWLAVVVVVAAGIGLAGGFGGPLDPNPGAAGRASATGGLLVAATTVDLAVVPVKTEAGAGVRSAADPTRHGPARWLLPLLAILGGVGGLVGSGAGLVRPAPPVAGRPPLRARRHAIALRAPPALRSV